jgi:hypothetical protein
VLIMGENNTNYYPKWCVFLAKTPLINSIIMLFIVNNDVFLALKTPLINSIIMLFIVNNDVNYSPKQPQLLA